MRNFWRIAAHSLVRPRLLLQLIAAGWRFRRRHWYRHPPFLPLPSAQYMQWRQYTAFGDENAAPTIRDLESYLAWAAWMRKPRRTSVRTDRHWKHF